MLPPGVTLGQYLRYTAVAFFTMFLGAQTVHQYSKPLLDMDKYIEKELRTLPESEQKKIVNQIVE